MSNKYAARMSIAEVMGHAQHTKRMSSQIINIMLNADATLQSGREAVPEYVLDEAIARANAAIEQLQSAITSINAIRGAL